MCMLGSCFCHYLSIQLFIQILSCLPSSQVLTSLFVLSFFHSCGHWNRTRAFYLMVCFLSTRSLLPTFYLLPNIWAVLGNFLLSFHVSPLPTKGCVHSYIPATVLPQGTPKLVISISLVNKIPLFFDQKLPLSEFFLRQILVLKVVLHHQYFAETKALQSLKEKLHPVQDHTVKFRNWSQF